MNTTSHAGKIQAGNGGGSNHYRALRPAMPKFIVCGVRIAAKQPFVAYLGVHTVRSAARNWRVFGVLASPRSFKYSQDLGCNGIWKGQHWSIGLQEIVRWNLSKLAYRRHLGGLWRSKYLVQCFD